MSAPALKREPNGLATNSGRQESREAGTAFTRTRLAPALALVVIGLSVMGCSERPAPPTPKWPARPAVTQVEPARPAATQVELNTAATKGMVKVSASGDGLESLNLSLESMSDGPLEITIAPGTIFRANSGGTQNMVAREERVVRLESRGSKESVTIGAACAEMHKDTPGESDAFTVAETPASEDLKKLLHLPEFRNQSFRVQQFAIWTITDNPSRDGYLGIGTFGFGEGPSSDELQRIRAVFQQAGIPTEKYRALQTSRTEPARPGANDGAGPVRQKPPVPNGLPPASLPQGPSLAAAPRPSSPPTPPIPDDPSPAPSPATPPTKKLELSAAVSTRILKVSATGDGLESVSLSIESMSDDPLEVTISAGTIFRANSGGTQNMVTREERVVRLEGRGSKKSLTIAAACAEMHKGTPGESDTFAVAHTPVSDDLKKLLRIPEFRSQSFRVQQFAIWTITDDPSRDGYVGIGMFGFGEGPSPDELGKIKALFDAAGISAQKYRAFRSGVGPIPGGIGRTKAPTYPSRVTGSRQQGKPSNRPKVGEPRPRPPAPRAPAQTAEEKAARELRMAKSLITANPDAAKGRLQRIIDQYPGTEAAREAGNQLSDMK